MFYNLYDPHKYDCMSYNTICISEGGMPGRSNTVWKVAQYVLGLAMVSVQIYEISIVEKDGRDL